jgi:hypothetical protein
LLRFAGVGVLIWVAAQAVSRGGLGYALAIPLVILALFQLVLSCAILWRWVKELRSVGGHT